MYGNSSSDVNNEIVKSTDSNSGNNNNNDIAFSKKAQHQCDADENLFLRFLELDPPVTTDQKNPPTYSKGRTPFTITKKLMKAPESSFGFSIVWTHPPRIEKIEPDSSAEKVGMLPGDYVVFIDKYNVVTMPELDILNLIRMQGNALTLEIFRRPTRQGSTRSNVFSPKFLPPSRISTQELSTDEENSIKPAMKTSSANMSNMSLENTKRRLRLPQVAPANNIKESLPVVPSTVTQQNPESLRKRYLIQLVNREQHFLSAINFGLERFVHPLRDRRDLISMNDHKTLFQNIDELVQLSEDILEQILQNEHDPQMHFVSRVYLSKSMALSAAYKKYCSGIKRSDCVLVNKSRTCNSDFLTFLNEPPIPKKRPDITTFIHRPLQHFRDILKLIQLISSNCPSDSEEYKNFTSVINELQAAYREITVGGGLMEPLGEGRPLLSLQDLESRLVFTKCKPFTLSIPGRQWIFGGDLSRIDGRSVKQFWTLLFSDIILFAKVSRDRVLFITDEPLPLSNVVDCLFNVKKKETEFRIVIDPQGHTAKSPNVNCAPDLSRTPLKSVKKRTIILRAPSIELKAVWQNLLTRQIYIVNTILGSTLNSPLESPDVMVSNLNLNDVNFRRAQSMASSKMCSLESFNVQQQQLRRNDQQQTQHQQNQQHKDENSNNKEMNKCNLPSSSQTVVDGVTPKPKINKALEELIDEKCSMLSKKGVSKEGSVHLAQWMKGQFNKNSIPEFEEEENNHDWSAEEVVKRSKELQLMHEIKKIDESEDEQQSQQSQKSHQSTSKSTTSGSQVTVRSSPINNNNSRSDSISICRQCHKFCSKKKIRNSISNDSNNNQLNKHAKQDSSCESSSTLKDITEDTPTEEIKEMRASQTMITLQNKSPIHESPLKTSTSSPSALQSAAKETKGVRIKQNSSPKAKMSNGICNCECKPKDFEKATISPDEVKHEIVKILTEVEQVPSKVSITDSSSRSSDSPYMSYSSIRARTLQSKYSFLYDNNHMMAATKNQPLNIIKETMIGAQSSTGAISSENNSIIEQELKTASSTIITSTITLATTSSASSSALEGGEGDNNSFSLMLAQSDPITSSVPAISILPPTPDLKKQHSFNATNNNLEITKVNSISIKTESSFDSIDDEEEEPPYVKLKTSLKKYGTMSSLERLPSEDTDDKTLDSSGDESGEEDLKITSGDTSQSYRTWTSRAGSFLEESKAFIDKYLGRNEGSAEYVFLKSNSRDGNDFDEYETIEGETSGATSGEDVWGTPTSGGENDEMHMFNNGDGNQTSPKSSSGDEDTEIMMDELLMAPMMTTASSIRGLLPRRRLEPLFEEDTDSCDSNNENSLLNNKEGEGVEKSIEKFPSSRQSSVDSDQATPSIDEEMMMNLEEMMSPTTRLAQQDLMSPLEDLDLDEMDIGMMSEEETLKTTTPVENFGRDADKSGVSALFSQIEKRESQNHIGSAEAITDQPIAAEVVRQTQSLRTIEMRLAMNNDIMGDEDLLNYPNLTSILGRDLSLYHRVSGRDIIMNRIMDHPKDTSLHRQSNACSSQGLKRTDPPNSFSQQKNSKMDTPIPKRKVAKQRIWSSSGCAPKEEKTALSDLEKLARREKIYCMTQQRENQANSDSDSISSQVTASNKSNKLFKILRRNSENMMGKKMAKENRHSYSSGDETSSSGQIANNSDSDKRISLDRRFFKQITKRRSNSLSDFSST